jgi:hypothetical protein
MDVLKRLWVIVGYAIARSIALERGDRDRHRESSAIAQSSGLRRSDCERH